MLHIHNIDKWFGAEVHALRNVSLEVAPGEVVALLGPSGCGKTTLLRVIAGLEQMDRGEILLDGRDLTQIPIHRRNFGFMFQDFALFPHQTVAENIAFGLRMRQDSAASRRARVGEMLELLNLQGYENRTIFELSGGERQRVALARSLAPAPRLLMLDEPLGSLDRTLRESLALELRAILSAVGVTAIYVTHDQQEAFVISDRLAIMRQGRIEQLGKPEEVYRAPAGEFVARFLGFRNLVPILEHAPDGTLTTPLGLLPAATRTQDSPPPQTARLLIRPEAVRVAAAAPDSSKTLPTAHRTILQATLISCAFLGSEYRIIVDVTHEGGAPYRLHFDIPSHQTDLHSGILLPTELPAEGEKLQLYIYPNMMAIISADE